MKIGILTQPLRNNYGGLLQNYALQQVLKKAGHDVETIDYGECYSLHEILYRLKMRLLSVLNPSQYPPIYKLSRKENAIISQNTDSFINKYISRTRILHTHIGFKLVAKKGKYDAFVVGSDQCWRPKYNGSYLGEMFLNFAKNIQKVKRIAYAASLGSDQWEYTDEQTQKCKELVRLFELVTVREESAVELCKTHFDVDAIHVLDPTMLLTRDDYVRLITEENIPQSAGTLFTYLLDPTEEKENFINRVAAELGLIPFKVLPKCQVENRTKYDIKHRINDCIFPGVTTWLRAFMDAEMTIVDSFHGMVLSIIFNKPFWVILNKKRGATRMESLLKMFHLEDRLLTSDALNVDIKNKSIDWQNVNQLLNQYKEKNVELLLKHLNKCL